MNKASSLLAKPIQENHKMDKTNTYKSYLDEYMAFVESHNCIQPDKNELYQKHHILPTCIGGDDSATNIVKLRPKDHLKAHELLFKAYYQASLSLAHVLKSMLGKECIGKIDVYIPNEVLEEFEAKADHAFKLSAKRTILDAKTLKPSRISMLSNLPDGFIEEPVPQNNDLRKIRIYNVKNLDIAVQKWYLSVPLPEGWALYDSAPVEVREHFEPGYKAKIEELQRKKYEKKLQRRAEGPKQWIHCIATGKNKLVNASQKIPDGWTKGMHFSDEVTARFEVQRQFWRNARIAKQGWRWIHDDNGNKQMIGKNDALPDGWKEGLSANQRDQIEYISQLESLLKKNGIDLSSLQS